MYYNRGNDAGDPERSPTVSALSEQPGLSAQEARPEPEIKTAAELSLYLIMILPDEGQRVARVKDFCRLYEISEKRAAPLEKRAVAAVAGPEPPPSNPRSQQELEDKLPGSRLFHRK